jgi:hypothetical protein
MKARSSSTAEGEVDNEQECKNATGARLKEMNVSERERR